MVVIDGAFCVEKLKLRATAWVYIAFECNVFLAATIILFHT